MTDGDERIDDAGLRPAWRRTDRDDAPEADEAELVDRGRTLAVLAALGRLQMSIDVLARQQKRHADEVEQRLARIERSLRAD